MYTSSCRTWTPARNWGKMFTALSKDDDRTVEYGEANVDDSNKRRSRLDDSYSFVLTASLVHSLVQPVACVIDSDFVYLNPPPPRALPIVCSLVQSDHL